MIGQDKPNSSYSKKKEDDVQITGQAISSPFNTNVPHHSEHVFDMAVDQEGQG